MKRYLVSLRTENGGSNYGQMTCEQVITYVISEAPHIVEVVRYYVRKKGVRRCTITFSAQADRDNGYKELHVHVARELRKVGVR